MPKRPNGEGSRPRQRKDGDWTIAISTPTGRRSLYGATQAAVVAKARAARQNLDAGRPATLARLTVREYLADWLEGAAPALEYSTTRRYRQLIDRHINPVLGHKQLAGLTPQDVRTLVSAVLAKGRAPATARFVRAVLASALQTAAEDGTLPRNVASLAPAPKVPKGEHVLLSERESRLLVQEVQSDPLEALYVLAATTGMRQGEILGLRWQDIDLDHGIVQVSGSLKLTAAGSYEVRPPKSEASRRRIRLPQVPAEALRRRFAAAPGLPGALVFTEPDGGPMRGGELLRRYWYPLLRQLGLPRVKFHALRHGYATYLISRGVPVNVVSKMLGHSRISITLDVYTHGDEALQHLATEAADTLFGAS